MIKPTFELLNWLRWYACCIAYPKVFGSIPSECVFLFCIYFLVSYSRDADLLLICQIRCKQLNQNAVKEIRRNGKTFSSRLANLLKVFERKYPKNHFSNFLLPIVISDSPSAPMTINNSGREASSLIFFHHN